MTLTVPRRTAIAIGVASVVGALMGLLVPYMVAQRSPSSGIGIHAQVAPLYKALPSTAHSVMLGDSLTHWGLWSELLPSKSVLNRGIAGDSIEKIATRLDAVVQGRPKVVFVMMGSNNLHSNVDVTAVAQRYVQVVQDIRQHQVEPIIQSTPLVGSQHADAAAFNQRVTQLNAILMQYAQSSNTRFIDLNAAMPHTDAYRLADGMHFNAATTPSGPRW
jgi:hypothetical protein